MPLKAVLTGHTVSLHVAVRLGTYIFDFSRIYRFFGMFFFIFSMVL
jgi:hypothetical protein